MRKIFISTATLIVFILLIYLQISNNEKTIQVSLNLMKEEITKDFHDPESARFRNIRLYNTDGSISEQLNELKTKKFAELNSDALLAVLNYNSESFQLCGEVNAKNSFGAYVGYKKFYVLNGKKPIAVLETKSIPLSSLFDSLCGENPSGHLIHGE
jgi:hypothetical protein